MWKFSGLPRALILSMALLAAAVTTAVPAAAKPEPGAPAEFTALSDAAPTIRQEMRYHSVHNFVGDPIDGYREPVCILTRPAARALHRAQQGLLRQGYSLKVFDCYRPQRAVDHFVRWAEDLGDQRMKGEFYPHVDKSRLFADGYIAEKSGHSRGSTVDLTIVKASGRELDMGTPYDRFDTLSHTLDPRIRGVRRENRLLLKDSLERLGFVNLPEEWWHFTYRPELFPSAYFDFPVERRSLAARH